jgi:uncharacterized surface protein with fasciclin (FAS1) repeats
MKRHFVLLISLLSILLPTSLVHAQTEAEKPTIAAYIEQQANDSADPEFTLLWQAIQAADPSVLETLNKAWGFTAFLPTDQAIESALESLDLSAAQFLADTDLLTNTLFYHLTIGQFGGESLHNLGAGMYATLYADHLLSIQEEEASDSVLVNQARITQTDIVLANGLVHHIDSLLIPTSEGLLPLSNPDAPQTILAILTERSDFTLFIAALEALNLAETVNKAIPYTLFAPTDETLRTFAEQVGISPEELLANTDTLTAIIQYHMVGGRLQSSALMNAISFREDASLLVGTQMPTTTLTFTLQDEALLVDGVRIVEADIVASNGYIHVVEGVLLP